MEEDLHSLSERTLLLIKELPVNCYSATSSYGVNQGASQFVTYFLVPTSNFLANKYNNTHQRHGRVKYSMCLGATFQIFFFFLSGSKKEGKACQVVA